MRRTIDLLVGMLFLVAFSPVMVVVAIGVWLTAGRPVLRQTSRAGQAGRTFQHYRFRTMTDHPKKLTRFGRVIGNLTLDELPAVWNLIRGDVTLIGPRAAKVEEVRFGDPGWQKVQSIRPGVVNPGILTYLDRFNRTDVRDRIEPDIAYVNQRSWMIDVKLLAKAIWLTVKTGHLKGRF